MTKALRRLVAVTCAVILVIAIFIGLIRSAGRQEGRAPAHPWFDRPRWTMVALDHHALCALDWRYSTNEIAVLPIKKATEGWVVACPSQPSPEAFLGSHPHRDWLLAIEAGAGEDLDKLVDNLNQLPGRRFGVYTRSQRASRALRKKCPQWVFAADDAALTRLHLFSSFFLEPVLEFWPDFVIASDASPGAQRLNSGEVEELRRRQKRIIWDGGASSAPAPYVVDGEVRRTFVK